MKRSKEEIKYFLLKTNAAVLYLNLVGKRNTERVLRLLMVFLLSIEVLLKNFCY